MQKLETSHGKEGPHIGSTTFRKLGIKDERSSKIGLLDEEVLMTRVATKEGSTIYIVAPTKPYTGTDFGDVLNHTAPVISTIGINARPEAVIAGDTMMPEMVRTLGLGRDDKEGKLYEDHAFSDVIGPVFLEYVRNHNPRWDRAINTSIEAERLKSSTLRYLNLISPDTQTSYLFSQKLLLLERMFGGEFSDADMARTLATFGRALLYGYKDPQDFANYVRSRLVPELAQDETVGYFKLDYDSRLQLLREYVPQLSTEEQEQFVIDYELTDEKSVLVDWKGKKVWVDQGQRGLWKKDDTPAYGVDFINEHNGVFKTPSASIPFEVQEDKDEAGNDIFTIKRVSFPPIVDFVAGLWAWEKTADGKRKFLSQEEAMAYVPEDFPNRGDLDVFFGRTQAAYLSRDITRKWPDSMRLTADGPLQPIRGAQVPVWVSLDTEEYPHARELLSKDNPLFRLLEKQIDKLPA